MHIIPSPMGDLYLEGDEEGISAVYFEKPYDIFPLEVEYHWSQSAKDQFDGYFRGDLREFDLPLVYSGTPLQVITWKYLYQKLPYGTTLSYSELALKFAHSRATRGVSSACAKNKLPILVPCHRILPKSGGIGEYNGGVLRKEFLLKLEASYTAIQ